MIIKFWGVRGAIPNPSPHTVKYGGNTPCIEVKFPELSRHVIIDAGSGIRPLGKLICRDHANQVPIEIFLTHTHWGHIMGFPFFKPLFEAGSKIKIYGPVTYEETPLKDVLGKLLVYRYFPIRQNELDSIVEFAELKEGRYDLGDGIILKTKYINHTSLCLGYRIEYDNKIFCTMYDTEPYQNIFCKDESDSQPDEARYIKAEQVVKEENERNVEFISGADLLVYDAQFTEEQYTCHNTGWGHSAIEHAVQSARLGKVKRLALFHHDPDRTDEQLDELSNVYCQSACDQGLEIFFAKEGDERQL